MKTHQRSIWRRIVERFSGKPEDTERLRLVAKFCKHDLDTTGVCSRCGMSLAAIIVHQDQ